MIFFAAGDMGLFDLCLLFFIIPIIIVLIILAISERYKSAVNKVVKEEEDSELDKPTF